ncbi:hypothetical protein K439DRAFT_646287 [Ramaria rubella]|nr:hypothetical protein K439DRAFT_646287 [Ramaria rubella]
MILRSTTINTRVYLSSGQQIGTPSRTPSCDLYATAAGRSNACVPGPCTHQPEVHESKDNARLHVHKHFGRTKLFQYVACLPERFGPEDAAKSHLATKKGKMFHT